MAGPINGLTGQQQIPLSQPSQLNQNANQVRQRDESELEQGRVQPRDAAPAQSQNSEAESGNVFQQRLEEQFANSPNGLGDEAPRRGSLVDVII